MTFAASLAASAQMTVESVGRVSVGPMEKKGGTGSKKCEVDDVEGRMMSNTSLTPGIYIIIVDGMAYKIKIR